MLRHRRRALIALSILVLGATVSGGVVAATQSSDEQALQPIGQAAGPPVDARVNGLLAQMTLEEKLEQIQLLPDFMVTDDEVRSGPRLGPERHRSGDGSGSSSDIAVDESRLNIPLLFAFDTIHGFRTIFPIPLGIGPQLRPAGRRRTTPRIGARESAAVGLKQTYAPMVDVSHEPRWGRISEGAGEDPYLSSVMAAARVKGFQGYDYSARDKLVASPKHFAAYGQPEGGRDYNTTDMSKQRLCNLYLPPFKAALDAGADTFMCSFNAINGVPGCGEPLPDDRHPQARVGLRRLRRERLDRGRRDARVPAEDTRLRRVWPRLRGRRARGGSARAERRRGLGDDQHADPRLRRGAAREARDLDEPDQRCGAEDPARQVPRRPVRAPVRALPAPGGGGADAPAGRGRCSTARRGTLDGAAEERGQCPAARSREEHGRDRAAGEEPARHARARGGAAATTRTWSPSSTASTRRTPARPPTREGCKLSNTEAPHNDPEGCGSDAGFAAGGRGRPGSRPGRARARRDAGDERRGELAQHSRPPGTPGAADRGDRGDRQAVRRGALQRPAARARGHRRRRTRDPARRGSPASREARRSPTSCSARSTPAASCRCRSRTASARCRSTTTTSHRAGPATRRQVELAHRDIPSCEPLFDVRASGSATRRSYHRTCGSAPTSVPKDGSISASVDVENTGRRQGTRWCSCTSTTRSPASRSRSADCAGSSV